MRTDYAYYPGCSLRGTGSEFAESMEAVFKHLGIKLEELPDWNCCGATSGHATAPRAALALDLRNLAQAAEMNKPVVVPCAACYHNMRAARLAVEKGDTELVKDALPLPAERLAAVEVVHPLEILATPETLALIKSKVVEPLAGFRAVSYYGCLLSRPAEAVKFDDTENPVLMDRLLRALGAEALDWSYKVDCCGGNLVLSAPSVAIDLISKILTGAEDAGANSVAVACPLCHANLDMRQFEASRRLRHKVEVPVFYFSELMAIAFDLPQAEKWLKKHITTPFPLIDAIFGMD